MLLENILGELVVNHFRRLTPFAAFLGGPLTQKKGKLETADSVVNPSQRFYKNLCEDFFSLVDFCGTEVPIV
jgi:hypothetical protein